MSVAILLATFSCVLTCIASALHFALRDFSVRKLELLTKSNGHSRASERMVRAITDDPDAHALSLGAIRAIANVALVIGVLGAFSIPVGGVVSAEWNTARMIGAGVTAVVLLYVFALVVPLSWALHAGERLIVSCAALIRLTHMVAVPFRVLHFLDEGVKRLAGAKDLPEKEQLEEELLDVVTESEREGGLDEEQREMIESVVEMGSVTTEEIMTPRVEVEGIALTDDIREIRAFIEKAGHSRIPVYEGDLDHIVGILYAKDLLRFLGEDLGTFRLRPMLRPALFVPENKPVNELMVQMRGEKVHLAIVLDEYGGTAGLVTLEDIIETIVGEIVDEYEPVEEAAPEVRVDDGARVAEIDARSYIEDANDALEGIGIALPESDEYDTVGGYVLAVLGHIPVEGETFDAKGFTVLVLQAEPTRVVRVRVEAQTVAEQRAAAVEAEAEAEAVADAEARAGGGEDASDGIRGGAGSRVA
jgi:putative hemolysin